jgi:hypothetical protein
MERLADELDGLEQLVRRTRQLTPRSAGNPRVHLPPDVQQQFDAQTRERKRVRESYRNTRRMVLERIEGAHGLKAMDVPPPQEVIAHLRTLARLDGGPGRRPLLVEFFVLKPDEVAVFLVPLWLDSSPVIVRIKLTRATVWRMTWSLLEATEVLARAQEWRGRGGPPRATRPVPSDADCRAARAGFARLLEDLGGLFEPWAEHLDGWQPTELILSPHYVLNLLPLHAATWGGQPLIRRLPVAYLPSPALAGEIARKRKPIDGEALLLGNPTGDLGGAEDEARAVAARLARRGHRFSSFLRERATITEVRSRAPLAWLVHFACHARLNYRDFLRSGVELADGRLSALDVTAWLELKRAVLVYLGSCASGQAMVGGADELMALVRVFFYAGSPSVLAALWELDDAAGLAFGDFFYKAWIDGGPPMAMAFQKAMLGTRELYDEPFQWAPFVLMGDWLGTVGPKASDRPSSGPRVLEAGRPARMDHTPGPPVQGVHRASKPTGADADVRRSRRAMDPPRAGGPPTGFLPPPRPDANRAAALNIAYQEELARWREELARWERLTFWRRWWTVRRPRPPEAPRGI